MMIYRSIKMTCKCKLSNLQLNMVKLEPNTSLIRLSRRGAVLSGEDTVVKSGGDNKVVNSSSSPSKPQLAAGDSAASQVKVEEM